MKSLFWCGILAAGVLAEPLTWNALVASVEKDPVLQASQRKLTAIGERSGTKLWNDLELEYSLDGFGFLEHDFELKIKPKAFGEGAASDAYMRSQSNYQRLHLAEERSAILYERYEHAIRYVKRLQIQQIHRELAQVAADRIEVLQALSGTETFRMQDLVTALEEKANFSAKMIADSNALTDSRLKLLSWAPGFDSVSLDTSFLPTTEEIKAILESVSRDVESFNEVAIAKAKWQLSERRAEQDAASDRNYISKIGIGYKYVYAKYKYKWVTTECKGSSCTEEWQLKRSDDDRRTQDKFYASIAFRLPFFSDGASAGLKRQIDVLEDERDYQAKKRDMQQKAERRREEIMGLIAQRDVQSKFVEQVDQGALFEDFANKAGNDPILLLRAREVALESRLKIAQLDSDIFTVYLTLLYETGVLARTDVTNHLKAGAGK